MVKVISGVSRLLLVGVVLALILAGCGGDWKARPGQTVEVSGPKAPSPKPGNAMAANYSNHMGLPPELGGACPAGFPIKGIITTVGVQTEQAYLTPENPNYESTKALKCFASADDAKTAEYQALQ